jgi:predicted DNA-binding transcriptional regulator AlpA
VQMTTATPPSEKLLLSAREAAERLDISERTLWAITFPRGDLRSVRVGSRGLRYSVKTLEKWIEKREAAAK